MVPYDKHVFVCENRRGEDDPRGCCAARGSAELRSRMKAAVEKAGLKGRIRVNSAGCLDQCARGPVVVVYPEAVWYERVGPDEADRIVREHLIGGRPVEDLRLDVTRRPGS
jgi:(2Fe-2S) ferredoxin